MTLDWKKLTIFFFLPSAVMAVLVAMYFSGNPFLENVVAMPHLEGVWRASRRELGLLENLQNALILATFVVAARGASKAPDSTLKAFFWSVAAVSAFMLLEEIDYGLHYYEYLVGTPAEETPKFRNIHNIGSTHSYMKKAGDILMILAFLVAPLALRRVRAPWVRYFLPDVHFLLTLGSALAISTIAHALDDRGLGVGLHSNISEFRETFTYYIGLLYVLALSGREAPQSTLCIMPSSVRRSVSRPEK